VTLESNILCINAAGNININNNITGIDTDIITAGRIPLSSSSDTHSQWRRAVSSSSASQVEILVFA